MAATDSSFIGFLSPGSGTPFSFDGDQPQLGFDAGFWDGPTPQSGQQLDGFMQQVVAGITGIDPTLVRPRWQEEPPNLPPIGTNWCAVGVTDSTPLGYPSGIQNDAPTGLGSNLRAEWEEFEVLVSFYGPNADASATLLRTGVWVPNNRDALALSGMNVWNTSGRRRAASLIQQRYMARSDITLNLRRSIQAIYPILYFLSAPIEVVTDTGVVSDRTAKIPSS